jgi:multidrug efflux system membrane fusion protein
VAGIGYGIVREGAGSVRARAGVSDTIGAEPVTVAPAEARDVPIWLSSTGSVQPLNAVTVKGQVDGQLDQVEFTEGQDVRAGEVLAKIDPRMYRAELDQATAKHAQDVANLANARTDLARYQKLAASSFALAQQVDTQRPNLLLAGPGSNWQSGSSPAYSSADSRFRSRA